MKKMILARVIYEIPNSLSSAIFISSNSESTLKVMESDVVVREFNFIHPGIKVKKVEYVDSVVVYGFFDKLKCFFRNWFL